MHHTEGLNQSVTLREFLRRRRKQLGFNQVDVARGVGLTSPDFISLVEIGQRRLSLERVPALARLLKVDQYQLCMLALRELFPVVARVLERGCQNQDHMAPVMTMAEEMAEKLYQLPADERQMAINMINVLYDKAQSGLRVAPGIQDGAPIAA